MRRIALMGLLLAGSAASAQGFVGKQGDDVVEAARKAADADLVRVIRPGTAVTMDFRNDRLNLKLDDKGKVVAITCG